MRRCTGYRFVTLRFKDSDLDEDSNKMETMFWNMLQDRQDSGEEAEIQMIPGTGYILLTAVFYKTERKGRARK